MNNRLVYFILSEAYERVLAPQVLIEKLAECAPLITIDIGRWSDIG